MLFCRQSAPGLELRGWNFFGQPGERCSRRRPADATKDRRGGCRSFAQRLEGRGGDSPRATLISMARPQASPQETCVTCAISLRDGTHQRTAVTCLPDPGPPSRVLGCQSLEQRDSAGQTLQLFFGQRLQAGRDECIASRPRLAEQGQSDRTDGHPGHPPVGAVRPAFQHADRLQAGSDTGHRGRRDPLYGSQLPEGQLAVPG